MSAPPVEELLMYCRPGCGACALLGRRLRRAGLQVREINIWQDPTAAEVVRGFARGNETVPTVVVGDVGLVNPNIRRVLSVVRERAPQLIPAATDRPGRARGLIRARRARRGAVEPITRREGAK